MVGYKETVSYHFSQKCPFEANDQKQKFQSFPSIIKEVAVFSRKREYKTMMMAGTSSIITPIKASNGQQ